ncbi:exodeoxyribonuclease VII large subunit [Ruminococcaceae bacterium R-25]|nr:exodeoxyribonuclease VII large subunit [Ruminococcaceae bacterium R-25]SUQ11081.1 Exodeoxyribonuclease VII large subunit [Oscillospiraceae bacterium]
MFDFESVSHLNGYIKQSLQDNPYLAEFSVVGEISQYTVSARDHAYFSIKDDQSVINCVIFSRNRSALKIDPQIGMKVKVTGGLDYYSAGGKLQMIATNIEDKGAGDLHEQFNKLFKKLQDEGLFDGSHKKAIPILPRRIGVVTSQSGKVISDIVNTIRKRNPHHDILLYPASVQGELCPPEVISGIKYFNENKNVDVIIVARGGGSYEELFCFNDEGIARAVYASEIPVISAIGHEPDYTIIDYVADVRAATPTAAGEMVIASYADQTKEIDNLALNLDIAINQFIDSRRKALDVYKNHKALHSPAFYAREQLAVVNGLKNQLDALSSRFVKQAQSEVNEVKVRLDALNPNNVLNRGYSYVCNSKGKAVESAKSVKKGDNVSIVLADGTLLTEIKDISIKTDGGSEDA